jgi:hypothetical protein
MMSKAKSTKNHIRIFVAAPMSGYGSDDLYKLHLKVVLHICSELEAQSCVEQVYFAGRDIQSIAGFTNPTDAFKHDYRALKQCDLFLMYYPTPVRSSVLVEAGIALGLGKRSFYACPTKEVLPYLLVNASSLSGVDGFPSIALWEWKDKQPDAQTISQRALRHADFLVDA